MTTDADYDGSITEWLTHQTVILRSLAVWVQTQSVQAVVSRMSILYLEVTFFCFIKEWLLRYGLNLQGGLYSKVVFNTGLTVLLFCYFQDVLHDQGCLPRLSKLLELQRMAMWLRHTGASTSVSITINAVTNLATNEKNNKDMEVSTCILLLCLAHLFRRKSQATVIARSSLSFSS